MFDRYKDIMDKIEDKPLWFDWLNVPRYQPFCPLLHPASNVTEQVLITGSLPDGTILVIARASIESNDLWKRILDQDIKSILPGDFILSEISQYWTRDSYKSNRGLPWYRNPFREGSYSNMIGFSPKKRIDNWAEPVYV